MTVSFEEALREAEEREARALANRRRARNARRESFDAEKIRLEEAVEGWQIRNLQRVEAERPYWTADIVSGETRFAVDDQYGSWQAQTNGHRRFVMPAMAVRLQAKVRPIEKRMNGS